MSANHPLTDVEALAALDWHRAAGVDVAVGDAPVDRFATSAAVPPRIRPPAAASAASAPAVPLVTDPAETRAIAAAATTLDELRAAMDAYEGCALKHRATQLCFADGNPEAEIMMVGEGPGEQEDKQGKPFVGRAGQLLDRMLAAIGLDRTKVYIANIVPWRPPGNRTPTPVETQICLPFVQRQIELSNPDVLVTIGQPSTGALLGVQGIMKNRGRWFPFQTGTREIRAMPMLHPAYLLRSPIGKRLAWRDMLAIKKALG